jgi:hypothetical protein
VEWGVRKITTGPGVVPPADPGMASKTLGELQTLCARKGIKYAKEDGATDLIQKLSAKK